MAHRHPCHAGSGSCSTTPTRAPASCAGSYDHLHRVGVSRGPVNPGAFAACLQAVNPTDAVSQSTPARTRRMTASCRDPPPYPAMRHRSHCAQSHHEPWIRAPRAQSDVNPIRGGQRRSSDPALRQGRPPTPCGFEWSRVQLATTFLHSSQHCDCAPGAPRCSASEWRRHSGDSRTALRRARSLRLARRMAGTMTGAMTFENPAGSPRLRSVMRVDVGPASVQV